MDVLFVLATVAVAQLVEPWIVIPVVVGSSPISHPKSIKHLAQSSPVGLFALWAGTQVLRWVQQHPACVGARRWSDVRHVIDQEMVCDQRGGFWSGLEQ